ncbi:MAG TPA: phospholipase A [Candidatus Krumholzibacteria bacterium]|nr:phospholipase A [Candidatus Krumholzibacteria bacterium]HPD73143.1 phospholipase A [Candidatus Krumholzibacteria bacterium]HRY41979.1 phospholipase A [Candidatus Krumholzibacteria bacterium]
MNRLRVASPVLLALLVFGASSRSSGAPPPEPFAFPLVDHGRGLRLHKEMYLLPYTYANLYHGAATEVAFQLSARHDLFGTPLYFAYTQISFWQAYNADASSPFRETDYNPEIFYRHRESRVGPGFLGVDAGAEHESNGQRVPLSRSWNLLYVAPFYHGDNWLAYLKLRYRLPEDEKETPEDPLGDDNPDITDYLGYSDIHLYYALPRGHLLHFLMRGYIGTDKGNVSLNYSFPIPGNADSFLVVRLFSGYGECLADYNRSIDRIGVGIMFNR